MLRNSLVIALLLAFTRSAWAAVVVVPVGPYGPYPAPYYYPPPEHLEVGNQYYDFSLHGLNRLCRTNVDFCSADQRLQLDNMEVRKDVGVALVITGIVAAVGGPLWTLLSAHRDATGAVRGNAVPLIVGLSAGVALPLTGGLIMPRRSELVDFVNEVNVQHPDNPVRLNIGGVLTPQGNAAPGVTMGMTF